MHDSTTHSTTALLTDFSGFITLNSFNAVKTYSFEVGWKIAVR